MSSVQPLEKLYLPRSSSRVVTASRETLAERIAPWVAGVACVWFALAAAWGLFGSIRAGHYGTMGSEGIIGENMIHWRILGPVWNWVKTPPTPDQYYCHHPWGGFWIQAVLVGIFGHHDFVLPLPAVLMSAATPPLLYGIGRAAWGKVAGAAAAVGFVFIPIVLGFANFHNLEVTVLFAVTLCFWGHARMLETWKWRYAAASLAGVALAASADWPAFVMLAVLLGIALVRVFVPPNRWLSPTSFRVYSTWWALAVTLSVGFVALWVVLFSRSDKLIDWLSSATMRGSGASIPLKQVLAARKVWIEISFTPFVIFLGKLAAPLAVLRFVLRRREEEAYSLAILAGATFTYVFFKQGADIHIFWSQYFGGYFALAFAQIIASLGDVGNAAARWLKVDKSAAAPQMVPLALTAIFALVMLPDAMRTLRYARETGGRYNQNGQPLSSETNIIDVLRIAAQRLPPLEGPDLLSPALQWSWAYHWVARGNGRNISSLPMEQASASDPNPIFMARASYLTVDQQKALVSKFHVEIYEGDVWLIDRRAPQAPLDAYTYDEREPSIWEWYFISGVEPMRKYVPDPYSTWEWRTHLGQSAEAPAVPPKTLDQTRIAHNIAVAGGDAAGKAAMRKRIDEKLVLLPNATFSGGITLLGYHHIQGTEPRMILLFQATDGTPKPDATFVVRAAVESRRFLSLIPIDPVEREVSLPNAMSTALYREGFIYSQSVTLRQRIGKERFWGLFQARSGGMPPTRLEGPAQTTLLVAR